MTSLKKISISILVSSLAVSYLFAETVTGGGYTVQQSIAPLQGAMTGNGYSLQGTTQYYGGLETGGSYVVTGGLPTSSTTSTSSSGGGSGGGGGGGGGGSTISGGGYFIFISPQATGTVIVTATGTQQEAHPTGSTCTTRITFSGPIDIGLTTNNKEDVKKLQTFLNVYEGESLVVDGVYKQVDVSAVKRWQKKYKSYILDPMRLKSPTGTVYTLSQRQIERQTTKACGEPIKVTACPYFKKYAWAGDRGDEVKKIQLFLVIVRGEKIPVSGVYGPLTKAAVKRFQQAYKKDIYNILKLSFISGNWNEATRMKANQAIGCDILK